MAEITINPDRMIQDLQALRRFGAAKTGVVRPAFSDADMEARLWLAERMVEAGLEPRFDPIGNLFGLPPDDAGGAAGCVLIGSHSDTQPEGGWLDGAYGVIAGLEVARASLECGGPPVAAVSFQDEEGRFGGLTGSRYFTGDLSLEAADALFDLDDVTLRESRLARAELTGAAAVRPDRFAAFLEIHIEQGPVLDAAGETLGVVEAIVGTRELIVVLNGQQNHAGTTPMPLRRDAFQGLAKCAQSLNEAFQPLAAPETVWTIGHVRLHPNATSIVPGRVTFSVQFRDADAARLERMQDAAMAVLEAVARDSGLELEIADVSVLPPARMDPRLVDRLAESAEAVAPGLWRRMPSGAIHDALAVAEVLPSGMLFVPSLAGYPHRNCG